MTKSSSNYVTDGIGDTPDNSLPTKDSLDALDTFIGSPLTSTTNMSFNTPHEPTQRRSLIEYFETLLTLSEAEKVDCCDSDGNDSSRVKDNEFEHYEDSIDEVSGGSKLIKINVFTQ